MPLDVYGDFATSAHPPRGAHPTRQLFSFGEMSAHIDIQPPHTCRHTTTLMLEERRKSNGNEICILVMGICAMVWGCVTGLITPSIVQITNSYSDGRVYGGLVVGLMGPPVLYLVGSTIYCIGSCIGQLCVAVRDFCNENRPIVSTLPPNTALPPYPGDARSLA